MTKRIIIASVLITSAFLIAFVSANFIVNELENIVSEAEADEDAFVCAEKILSLWKENEKYFSLILKHTDADTADRMFFELEEAIENENEAKLIRLIAEIKAFLSVTAEGEKAKIENIF